MRRFRARRPITDNYRSCLAIPHATRAGSRTLQLKGDKNTYTLEPLSQQGSRSYVYQVVGGWGTNKTPAIAKMFRPGENDADDISDETDFAKKVSHRSPASLRVLWVSINRGPI